MPEGKIYFALGSAFLDERARDLNDRIATLKNKAEDLRKVQLEKQEAAAARAQANQARVTAVATAKVFGTAGGIEEAVESAEPESAALARQKAAADIGQAFQAELTAAIDKVIRTRDKIEVVVKSAEPERAATEAEKAAVEAEKAAAKKEEQKQKEADALTPAFDTRFLNPEFAIGQGLLTREEYVSFRNGYLAQSELTVGMIFPLALIIFACAVNPQMQVRSNPWVLVFLILATAALVVLAVERRQKYKIELATLLLGRWEKQAKADKDAKQAKKEADAKSKSDDTAADKKMRKVFKEELEKLRQELKPIVVEVHTTGKKSEHVE
jgi:hypothetical protein